MRPAGSADRGAASGGLPWFTEACLALLSRCCSVNPVGLWNLRRAPAKVAGGRDGCKESPGLSGRAGRGCWALSAQGSREHVAVTGSGKEERERGGPRHERARAFRGEKTTRVSEAAKEPEEEPRTKAGVHALLPLAGLGSPAENQATNAAPPSPQLVPTKPCSASPEQRSPGLGVGGSPAPPQEPSAFSGALRGHGAGPWHCRC